MDVSDSVNNRELENLRRFLKTREEEHSRELDGMRAKQRDQIQNLSQNQAENVRNLRQDQEKQLLAAKQAGNDSVEKITDSYQRNLNNAQQENYDRFGKLRADYADQRNRDQQTFNKQFQGYMDSTQHGRSTDKEERDATIKKMRDDFEKGRREQQEYVGNKLSEQKMLAQQLSSDSAEAARKKVDTQIQRNAEDMNRERIGADMQKRKLVGEGQLELKKAQDAGKAREDQLLERIGSANGQTRGEGLKTMQAYQDAANQYLKNTQQDYQQEKNKRDFDTAKLLSTRENEHARKEQDLKSELANVQTDLVSRNRQEKDTAQRSFNAAQRRASEQSYLAQKQIELNDKSSRADMAEDFSDRLSSQERKGRDQVRAQANQAQQQIAKQQHDANMEIQDLKNQGLSNQNESRQKSNSEKTNIVRTYEERERGLTDATERQIQDTKQAAIVTARESRSKSEADVNRANRESQRKVFEAQENLRRQSELMELDKKVALDASDQSRESKIKRLTENYGRTLNSQTQRFEEITGDIKYDTSIRLNRVIGEAEFEKRRQLMDLQARNREMIENYETKLNNTKDLHEAELAQQKGASEKAVREVLAKTRQMMEDQRIMHTREIDAKDSQMKEKLKQQEAAFRESMERLKRTNELATKKS